MPEGCGGVVGSLLMFGFAVAGTLLLIEDSGGSPTAGLLSLYVLFSSLKIINNVSQSTVDKLIEISKVDRKFNKAENLPKTLWFFLWRTEQLPYPFL